MMVDRKDPDRFLALDGEAFDAEKFADQDVLIRSGMCPNGHGLMERTNYGQRCPTCKFFCNIPMELSPQ
jgi:hypothetical protein